MGKVADKILAEAKEKKKKTVESAKEKAKSIKKEAKEEASKIKKQSEEKAKEAKEREKERLLSQTRMELSTEKLKAKHEVIKELKDNVRKKIENFKWGSEYKPFIKDLIQRVSDSNDEEIVIGSKSKKKVKKLIDSLNKKKKFDFSISDGKGDFKCGVILKKGNKSVNASLSALIGEAMEELEEDIVRILFGEK